MALADSVPGVSGGTIAFILGFYDEFIGSLNDLFYGKMAEKKKAFFFLIKLGLGWIFGAVLAILILANVFESHIYLASSLFLGFIMVSIPIVIKEEKKNLIGKYRNLIFTALGIAVVVLITYFNPMTGSENIVDVSNLNLGLGLYIFVVAMVAISAMVLPGISGSTLLLIFGLYIPIVTAVKQLLHLDFSVLPAIIIFIAGVLIGIKVVIKLIKIALEKYRSATIYTIVGLLIGSLYAIMMGPTTLSVPESPMSMETFNILFFILGGIIILGLERVKILLSKKVKEQEQENQE